MQAKSDPSDQAREHLGLPLSTDLWGPRGGSAWLVGGVCTLALAAVVHLKFDPVAARARNEGDSEQPAAAASERATLPPQAPAPAPAAIAVDDHARAEQTTAPRIGEAQAVPSSQPSPAKSAAGQSDSNVASAGEQSPKPARRSKRASAELQRLRRDLTLAANLESPGAQGTATPVDSSAQPALSEHTEAALEGVPASAPPPASAPTPAIPDNPY